MSIFVLRITTPGKVFNDRYVPMVDFSSIEEARNIIMIPGNIQKIEMFFHMGAKVRTSDFSKVITMDEFIEDIAPENCKDRTYSIIDDAFIMNCSDDKVRLIFREGKLTFNSLMCTKIIKISVFDQKEDTAYPPEEKDIVNKYLDYKKIGGDLTYIRTFENTASLVKLIDTIRDINKENTDEMLGFLVEYRDVKLSTIKFVEGIMSNIEEPYHSVSIVPTTDGKKNVDVLFMYDNEPVFTPARLSTNDECIVLYDE